MMRVRLVDDVDAAAWTEALEGIPHAIAHTHGFASAMARVQGTTASLFVAEDGNSRFICPVAVRDFHGNCDIFSPYGFGGFAGIGDPHGLRAAWAEFAATNGYVAAFITQNPLLMPDGMTAQWPGITEYVRTIYRIDLTQQLNIRLGRVSARTRSGLRKWLERATIEHDQDLLAEAFVRLYPGLAERRDMSALYHFDPVVLRRLTELPDTFLVGARSCDGIISCVALMAATSACGDYLFMASSPDGNSDGTGVLWCGLEKLAERKVPVCNLGGGISEGDGVAEFKRRIGGEPLALPIVQEIFDTDRYAALCRVAGVVPAATGFFPAYHAKAVRP